MSEQVPTKEMTLEDALELCRKHAAWFPNVPSVSRTLIRAIERLQTALRGIQSCSTCEACRGAATLALGGAPPEPAAECTRCHCMERAQKFLGDPRQCVGVQFNPAPHAAVGASSSVTGVVCGVHGFFPRLTCPVCMSPAQPPGDGQCG